MYFFFLVPYYLLFIVMIPSTFYVCYIYLETTGTAKGVKQTVGITLRPEYWSLDLSTEDPWWRSRAFIVDQHICLRDHRKNS
jgi:hypothetical protein